MIDGIESNNDIIYKIGYDNLISKIKQNKVFFLILMFGVIIEFLLLIYIMISISKKFINVNMNYFVIAIGFFMPVVYILFKFIQNFIVEIDKVVFSNKSFKILLYGEDIEYTRIKEAEIKKSKIVFNILCKYETGVEYEQEYVIKDLNLEDINQIRNIFNQKYINYVN